MTDTTEKSTSNPTADTTRPIVEELLAGMPFDGSMKRLEVHGDIPGHRLQWVNDRGSRVPTLIRYGWNFVKKDEIALNDRVIDGNQAVDDRVKRVVGQGSGGEGATYAYLMKCPEELWQKFQAAMQVRPDNFDRMLLAGFADAGNNQYNPSHITPNKVDASELMEPQAFPGAPNQQTGGMRRPPHRMGGPSIRNR